MLNLLLVWNPVLIIGLLVYQHYKIKLLANFMAEQRKLISETKDVVTHQSTAIASQASVVDTAIRYSQAFDPGKLEEMLRKQLAIEYHAEKFELQKQVENLRGAPDLAKQALEIAQNVLQDLFTPVMLAFIQMLFSVSQAERARIVASIESNQARGMVQSIVVSIESKIKIT